MRKTGKIAFMNPSRRLRTARMRGRPISIGDFSRLRMIQGDPRAAASLTPDGKPMDENGTRQALERWARHWSREGFGVWMFSRDDGEFVGYAGVMRTAVEGRPEIELLYAVRPAMWGTGAATEMSEAVLRYAFEEAGIVELVAFTLPANTGSRRVMEKCGFRFERDITHAGLPHVLYRITAEEFAAAHA
jgi:RimJ/RimL family protein N-acetyltransferase